MMSAEPRWRKPTRSANEGNCVEVADNLAGVVLVRDSKDRAGPALTFGPESWRTFVAATRLR
ncbi:DUF397 domain-containing protein [Salinispora oceanensis]|uniref:DUF397 domain-containing protein n=1 Tax=Salinispora oceanensis TaxID=1050199 RepID=UPI0003A629BF|nr:DUF397 domain-containing protein [Salinispora oceanensis]